jgi:hypothetical protein
MQIKLRRSKISDYKNLILALLAQNRIKQTCIFIHFNHLVSL